MPATAVKSFAIANIAAVDIIEEKKTGAKTYRLIEVASKATASPLISQGKEEELRVKNTIHAQNITEDITKGYEVTLESVEAVMEVLALVDGGTWDGAQNKYSGAVAGKPTERTPFTLKVYTEEKDYDGDTKNIVCFTFKHCKGTPITFDIQDGTFLTQEMKLKSRPKFNENAVEMETMAKIPDIP